MAKDCRTPGSHVINVLSSFDVPYPCAFGLRHEKRLTANVAKGSDRRVHSTRDKSFGLGEKSGTGHVRQNNANRRRCTKPFARRIRSMSLPVKFDHCVVHVTDWERSNQFYREVVGAEVIDRNGRFAYRFGETQL